MNIQLSKNKKYSNPDYFLSKSLNLNKGIKNMAKSKRNENVNRCEINKNSKIRKSS